jgi:hypothetical protein
MRRDLLALGAAGLLSCLCGTSFGADADPTAATITTKMETVTDDLGRKQTGKPVQTTQKEIVGDLDALIAKLEQQCQNCKGAMKRNNPRKGMDDSRIGQGTGGIGTLLNPTDNGKDWGKLSGRERDRILQSMSEGFPPEYRTVLERYYRRLAEEKTAGKAVKATETAKAPAEKP